MADIVGISALDDWKQGVRPSLQLQNFTQFSYEMGGAWAHGDQTWIPDQYDGSF